MHPEAAEGVLALRREADVRHHRDAGLVQQPDLRSYADAALELDRLRAALLHHADGGVERLLRAGLVGAEGQVGHDQRALRGAGDGLGHEQQVLDGHRHRAAVPEDDVARGVADEHHRDAGLLEDGRAVGVVGGEHRPFLAALLGLLQVVDPHPRARRPAVQHRFGHS